MRWYQKIMIGFLLVPELLLLSYLAWVDIISIDMASSVWLFSIFGVALLGVMLWARPKKNINHDNKVEA